MRLLVFLTFACISISAQAAWNCTRKDGVVYYSDTDAFCAKFYPKCKERNGTPDSCKKPYFDLEPPLDPRDAKRMVRYPVASGKRLPVVPKPAQLRYLDNAELALSQHFSNIRLAKKSIDMTYYEWDPCSSVTKALTKELEEKAKELPRGSVRLLIDAHTHSAKMRRQFTEYMRRKGIAVRYFNIPPVKINKRTHAKLDLVDGERFISGGRNMTDDYFALSEKNYIDRDVNVIGAAAREAQYSFNDLWNYRGSQKAPSGIGLDLSSFEDSCTDWTKKDKAVWNHLDKNAAELVAKNEKVSCENVRFIMDDIAVGKTKPTTSAVLELLAGAKSSISIENYSYLPVGSLNDILKEKREAGVAIKVFSNSFNDDAKDIVRGPHHFYMSRDNRGSQSNYRLSPLGSLGDRWAQSPDGAKFMIHAKVFTADGANAMISSFNIDPRSYGINVESGVAVEECKPFVSKVEESSKLIGKAWVTDLDCAACSANPGNTIMNKALQWLAHDWL